MAASKQNRFIITFFYVGVFFVSTDFSQAKSPACENWKFQCKDIQGFRENKRENAATQNCPPAPATSVSHEIVDLNKALEQPPSSNFNQLSYMGCFQSEVTRLKEMQAKDNRTLQKEMQKIGLNSLTLANVEALFLKPGSSFDKLLSQMKADQTAYFYYRDYALSGPYQNMIESLTGYRQSPNQEVGSTQILKYDHPGLNELKDWESKGVLLENLLKRSAEIEANFNGGFQISPNTNREAITPTIAKIILFELIRDRLKNSPAEFLNFAKTMELKFDYADPFAPEIKNPNSVTIHNGYFLGVDPSNFPSASPETASASKGYDCTAILQMCLEKAGIRFPADFKLLSTRLAILGDPSAKQVFPDIDAYAPFFDSEPYECEAQLRPGDVIAFPGHAFIFAGYGKDKSGQAQLLTYEAIAGEYRSFDEFQREIYGQEGACGSPRFSSSGQSQAKVIHVRTQ